MGGEKGVEHYLELARISQERNEPLRFAHAIRHAGDFLRRESRLAEAEPRYREALLIYRREPEAKPLDVANAIRGFALLKSKTGPADEAIALWREARDLYAVAGIEVAVAESGGQLAILVAE